MASPTQQPKPLIAAGIARVSLEKQAREGYSLDAQDSRFDTLSEKFAVEIPAEFRLEDAGYTGGDFNRPSIKHALKLAREGRIKAVVFPHLDRFARNVEGGLNMIRQFRELDVQVLLGDLGWYTDATSFKMQMTIGLLFAEITKDEIRQKSHDGTMQKLKEGKPHGGHAPYGFRFVTLAELQADALRDGKTRVYKGNEIVPVPEQLAIVALIFELADGGATQREICRQLIRQGVPPPKSNWNPMTVSKILRETLYTTGCWNYNKRQSVAPDPKRARVKGDRHRSKSSWKMRPESEWKPIRIMQTPLIERALFDRVALQMTRNTEVCVGRPSDYELTGLVKCAECGKSVGGKRKGDKTWYCCSNRDRVHNQSLCPQGSRSVRGPLLEATVWDAMVEELIDPTRLRRSVDAYQNAMVETINTAEMEALETRRARINAEKIEMAKRAFHEQDPELKELYESQVEELKAQAAHLRQRLEFAVSAVERARVDCDEVARTVKDGTRTKVPAERKQILRGFVEGVTLSDGEAEITLRVPLATDNCKSDVPAVYNFILLKTKRRVA
jgi:site-specific DNA recombinase